MMPIKCQWCGWSYTMGREALLLAVAKAQVEKTTHYIENCPKCRRAMKIQVAELKRRVPPGTVLPDLTAAPAPTDSTPEPPAPAPAATPTPAKKVKEKKVAAKK